MSISMSAPMTADRSSHVLEAVPNRLGASPQRPRRRWSAQAKARPIEASLEPGANVSAIAREAGRTRPRRAALPANGRCS